MAKKTCNGTPAAFIGWDCLVKLLDKEKPESLGESLRLTDIAQRFYHPVRDDSGQHKK